MAMIVQSPQMFGLIVWIGFLDRNVVMAILIAITNVRLGEVKLGLREEAEAMREA
tara:strand:- start:136 stop:300 length:165 start_codon:yes stop_codon:yes gene_type:complete